MIINLCGGSGGGSSAPIKLQGLIARENGTYTPDEGYDGYSEVLVDVTEPAEVFVVPDGMKFSKSTFTTLPEGLDFSNVTNMSYILSECTSLQTITSLNTSNASSMYYLFGKCENLASVPLLDTSNVNDMSYMFYQCKSLTTIPHLNTSNVTSMVNMFFQTHSLDTLPLLDTSSVKTMAHMFDSSNIKTIPLFDTSNVNDMSYMFYYSNIKELPLLDTGNVKNMYYMFKNCLLLTTIPNINTSNVTDMRYMFSECSRLQSIPLLDCRNADINNIFYYQSPYSKYNDLVYLGGFKDLKKSVTQGFLEKAPNLSVESLMNVINNVYDLTANGLSGKSMKFGQTNLDKLTPEQIAVATAKGWTLTA
jgi:surface protein